VRSPATPSGSTGAFRVSPCEWLVGEPKRAFDHADASLLLPSQHLGTHYTFAMTDLIPSPAAPGGQFLLYQTEDGRARLEVRLEADTVWLSQKLMAELFQKDVRTINEHIQTIFEEGELAPDSVVRKFRITAADGKSYETQHYNLDVIISVGYRVKSHRGTQFRIWATQRLREYLVKGFALARGHSLSHFLTSGSRSWRMAGWFMFSGVATVAPVSMRFSTFSSLRWATTVFTPR